ncbi:MAG: hypothetical protein M8352_02740 [ANME-2 cluster archaeon]|nr:hypothetical protein [ANME-2 cluster archaeon]MDF1532657.1 hypothetical protein [ANME-2 cluster archaeon]
MEVREFDLEQIVPPQLRERMEGARTRTIARSGRRLNFYITSNLFPSISITGSQCSLHCKHCGGKLLERLIPCTTPDDLVSTALVAEMQGAKGILVTGGCDPKGRVPVPAISAAIATIKERTDLRVIAHTGFITPDEAGLLQDSGLDGAGFDVVGDMTVVREVYGLDLSEQDYISSLDALSDAGIMLFPHVCVGLNAGRAGGELHALEMIRGRTVSTVVITGLMPIEGTPFSGAKPDPMDFARVITAAVELFPDTPITLGCARSSGRDRELIDYLAIESGVENIAIPTRYAVEYAKRNGYSTDYYGTCCGLPPSDDTRIDTPLYDTRAAAPLYDTGNASALHGDGT